MMVNESREMGDVVACFAGEEKTVGLVFLFTDCSFMPFTT